jgi:hypothetical protein
MSEHGYAEDLDPDFSNQSPRSERNRLAIDLQTRIAKLNEQARIFLPLIALGLIVAIPVWSKSPARFLELLMSPFVFLPLGFSVIHLARAWRGIARVRARIRDCDRTAEKSRDV